jgi:hypothetical protein
MAPGPDTISHRRWRIRYRIDQALDAIEADNPRLTGFPSHPGRGAGVRDRRGEVLFIDARQFGRMDMHPNPAILEHLPV